jgi:hypothetical protein
MLGPEQKDPPHGLTVLKASENSTLGILVDMIAPSFKAILFEKLDKIAFKDLPKLQEGQTWVFQFIQDLGSIWSLYVGVVVEEVPQGPIAKLTVVVKPNERKGDLFYKVDCNKKIIRRLDKGPFLVILDPKGRNYATVLAQQLLDKIKQTL